MTFYIPRCILVLNAPFDYQQEKEIEDYAMARVNYWAEEMRSIGKNVYDITIIEDQGENPLTGRQKRIFCKIECTEEERKMWEETRKLQIELAVLSALEDKDE
jgi:hypothetical protein